MHIPFIQLWRYYFIDSSIDGDYKPESKMSNEEELKKEMNKIYSRRNRRKKKEYVKQLENKILALEQKVEKLTDQLYQYKIKVNAMVIGDENDFKDYTDYLIYLKTDFKDLWETWKDGSWREKYQKVIEVLGPTGKWRQALIKNSFQSIIDNALPDGFKYIMQLASKLTGKATKKQYSKLFKMSNESALEALKSEEFDEADRILFHNNSSTKVREFLFAHQKKALQIKEEMTDTITKLLELRK